MRAAGGGSDVSAEGMGGVSGHSAGARTTKSSSRVITSRRPRRAHSARSTIRRIPSSIHCSRRRAASSTASAERTASVRMISASSRAALDDLARLDLRLLAALGAQRVDLRVGLPPEVLDLGARHLEDVLGRLLGGREDGGDARADARGRVELALVGLPAGRRRAATGVAGIPHALSLVLPEDGGSRGTSGCPPV